MKLKDNKKPFTFENLVKDIKKKFGPTHSSPQRRHVERSNSTNDFSLRLGRKLGNKKTKDTKWKVFAQRAAIFASLSFLFLVLIGILVVLGLVSAYSKDLPNVDKFLDDSKKLGKETVIYDRNGVELYRLRGDVVNERLTLNDVPDKMQWAFMAAEDANFKNHKGLDLFGLSRALTCIGTNYLKRTSTDSCGGGSSITQQLIKKTTLTDERSLDRKVKEAILAMRVEEEYSKDQILEDYLNIVPEGREYVGAKTGSVYIFGQSDLNKLSLAQMAFLAAIPNNPEVLSPRGAAYDITKSQERALYVLDRMYDIRDRSKVTKEEIDAAKAEVPNMVFVKDIIQKKAPHFVNQVIQELDNDPRWKDRVAEGQKGSDYFRDKGYKIYTTVDLTTQELLEKTIREQAIAPQPNLKGQSFVQYSGANNEAAVVIDNKTGEIMAMVGSRDFYAESTDKNFAPEFNAATGDRSMGSSVKPILYMTAFTKGLNPLSPLPDLDMFQAPGYKPKNFDQGNCHFLDAARTGRCDFVSIRQALRFSLNQPAVSAANIVTPQDFGDMYVKLTGRADIKDRFTGPAAALGAANIPLVDQVHAYSTIASMGSYKPKKYILEIKDENGDTVFDNKKVESSQVIDAKFAYLITNLNQDYWFFATDPTVQQIRKTNDFAGKTGTSDTNNGPGDVLFMGYTPDVTIGMWAGNSCPPEECHLTQKASSDDLYKYIYTPFIKEYSKTFTPSRFQRPEGIRTAAICNLTGNAYSDDCGKAGGKSLSDLVADTAQPKAENMIEKIVVAPCPDTLKIARDVDKDAGVAQDAYYIRYDKIFSQKFLSDQVFTYITGNNYRPNPYPTQTCDIARSLQPPSISITNPTNGWTYSSLENLPVSATVTSGVQLAKVEVTVNNQIVKTFSGSEAVQFNLDLSKAPVGIGSNTIKVIATNVKGVEVTSTASFAVQNGPATFVTSPTSGAQISYASLPISGGSRYIQLFGRIAGGNAAGAQFVITGSCNGIAAANPTGTGNLYAANFILPPGCGAGATINIDLVAGGNQRLQPANNVKITN